MTNVEQFRKEIDTGRTGDKVDWPDPAAAPLGADEEAAGTPVSPAAVGQARAAERRDVPNQEQPRRIGAAWVLIGIAVLIGLALILWLR
jgi:hypothetical protein